MKRIVGVLLALVSAACGDLNFKETLTNPPGTKTLTGVAAVGAPIASGKVTFKDATGATASATTAADGSYTLKTAALTFPVLLRVDSPQGPLFSAAFEEGVTNVHPFTNLVVRNWYTVQGVDVVSAFDAPSAIRVPSVVEVETIKAVVLEIVGPSLAQAGIDLSSFDLFGSPFQADGSGFDGVLDRTEVKFQPGTSEVTIATTDPATGLQATSTLDVARDLAQEDATAPTKPVDLVATAAGPDAVVLTWAASTDGVAVTGYSVYRDGARVAGTGYPLHRDAGLKPNTTYCYEVEALDAKRNVSERSARVCARTLTGADSTAPSAPAQMSAESYGALTIRLSWSPSTDAAGVLGYRVFRSGALVASVPGTQFDDRGLTAGAAYCYVVVAFDAAGNASAAGPEACATALAAQVETAAASGTYTYASGALTLNATQSADCGPQVGRPEVFTVTDLSPTSMTWVKEGGTPIVWTRAAGTGGDVNGTWQATSGGPSYTLTLNPDGSWRLVWDAGACDSRPLESARGTYSFAVGTLSIHPVESSGCDGPQAGQDESYRVGEIGATSMTWTEIDDTPQTLVWSRPSGTPGVFAGTWTMVLEGRDYTLTAREDGSWSLVWEPGSCEEPTPVPAPALEAWGSFTYGAGVIGFEATGGGGCIASPAWFPGSFTVGSVDEFAMTWQRADALSLTWTRLAAGGAGVEGSWGMNDGSRTFVLALRPDGSFSLTANGECAPLAAAPSARGSYTYELPSFTLYVEQSPECAPLPLGPAAFTIGGPSETSMTWTSEAAGTITWTRSGGAAGVLVGGWERETAEGLEYLVLREDGSFELIWSSIRCDQAP